ncbi:HDOD domain-containing protein [bacterium]|nr:HDOD domain-containing protein [bacterium]
MSNKLTLNVLINRVEKLPALPHVISLVLRKIDDPRSSITDIAKTLSGDEGLAANVLKLANSAYYGFPRRVVSVTEAVVILGLNTLKSLIYTVLAKDLLGKEVKGYALNKGELWRHSIACAIICREIARKKRLGDIESFFVAGLLHDIGKIVLDEYLQPEYEEVVKRTSESLEPFNVIEKEILGFDHQEVGGLLAKRWNLPDFLVSAISHHHDIENITTLSSKVVHVGDGITLMMGYGLGIDGLMYQLSQDLLEEFGLSDESKLEEFISYVDNLLTAAYQFFEL